MKHIDFSEKDIQKEIGANIEDGVAKGLDNVKEGLKGELSAEVSKHLEQKVTTLIPKPNYLVRFVAGFALVATLGGLFVNDCLTRRDVNSLRDEQTQYNAKLSEQDTNIKSNTKKIEQLDTDFVELKREFDVEKGRLSDGIASLSKRVESLDNNFDRFRTTFQRETVNPLIEELRDYRVQISEIRSSLAMLKQELPSGLNDTIARIEQKLSHYDNSLNQIKSDYDQTDAKVSSLTEKTSQLREDMDSAQPILTPQSSPQLSELEQAVSILTRDVGELESDLSLSAKLTQSQLSNLRSKFEGDKTRIDSEIDTITHSLGYDLAHSGIQRYLTQHGRIEFGPSDNPLEAVYTFFRNNRLNDDVEMAVRFAGSVENFVDTYLVPKAGFREDWKTSYVGKRFWITPLKPKTNKKTK